MRLKKRLFADDLVCRGVGWCCDLHERRKGVWGSKRSEARPPQRQERGSRLYPVGNDRKIALPSCFTSRGVAVERKPRGSASFVRGGRLGAPKTGPEAEALKADTNGAAYEMTVGPGDTHRREAGLGETTIQDFSRSFRSGTRAAGRLRKMYSEWALMCSNRQSAGRRKPGGKMDCITSIPWLPSGRYWSRQDN